MLKPYLMLPGPTPVPERVLNAMHQPMINHRGTQFAALIRELAAGLKQVFQTREDVIIFPAAGTGVMEAAIVNFLSPGDKVLAISIGVFGDRFVEIAAQFGAVVEKMNFPWGEAADPAAVATRLARDTGHEIKAILVTHNETSTGVANDIAALSRARNGHPALLMVDAVSSLGAMELLMDEWGLDVVVTGSQKALMIPPGLGFVAVSARAREAMVRAKMPKYYWDLAAAQKSLAKDQTPYTPALPQLCGLKESLAMIAAEGLPNIFARHRLLRDAVRAGVKTLGLELLAADDVASPGVTAVKAPQNIEAKAIQKVLREAYGVTTAGGQKALEGKIFRIGHLGYVGPMDIIVTLAALEMALAGLGAPVELGQAVRAAQQVFLQGRKQG